MKQCRIITLLVFLISFPVFLHAQSRFPGVISGKTIDGNTKAPVEYTNIVLKTVKSDSMVNGTVSDSTGFFQIKNVPFGTYVIEYSFIGYEKKRTDHITVDRKKSKIDVGELNLVSSSVTMNEVTVTAERNMMITKIDRKVFNVQTDIQSQTGTVSDVLQTIPSISVDMDGNISLRGSGNVTILIDGRPSVMGTAANLDQMPASLIEKIEVITNPSAKYKPDGTAGIINIILKKEQKTGFNSTLGANAGSNSRFNTNLQLNFNTGKVNLFGSYGYRQDYRWRSSDLQSQTIDTTTNNSVYLTQTSEGSARPSSHLGQLGLDWAISKKDDAGISGTFNFRQVKRNDVTNYLYRDTTLQTTEQFWRDHTGNESETSLGLKANYEHTFNKENEHVLRADFEYQRDSESEEDDYNNVYQIPVYPDQKTRSTANNKEENINLSVNYNRPLWSKASMEAGYEGNIQLTHQDQRVDDWMPESGQWITDTTQANRFYANQTVHAIFTTLSCSWGKFSMMAGLRAEETLLNLEFRTLNAITKSDYFALYPTLHLSLASGKNEWQLNYSRRVNRPDGEDMNPVPEYRDPRNIFVGNPNLKPEDIHSIELGYSLRLENLTLVPTLFYRYKVHGFTIVTSNLNDSVLVTTIDNLATDQSAGIDLSGTWQIAKIANLNFSTSGFYSQIDASNIGYSANKSTFSWNAKLNASISITKTTLFQFTGQYRSEMLTAQGNRQPTWVINLGLRQDLWKRKILLIATVSDLFNSQTMKSTVNTPLLVQESTRNRDGRVFYAGFVFNFGTNGKKSKDVKFEFDTGTENR
ncbi:MAG: TonB-dependent receptor [Bacteroidales bacterium]|nr:TonB-dependent receptor [Bacteroidales bacterium]